MTLPEHANLIYCQNCGSGWDKDGIIAQIPMFHFEPKIDVHQYESVADIVVAGVQMTACPKDPMEIDAAMQTGPPRHDPEGDDAEGSGSGTSEVVELGDV